MKIFVWNGSYFKYSLESFDYADIRIKRRSRRFEFVLRFRVLPFLKEHHQIKKNFIDAAINLSKNFKMSIIFIFQKSDNFNILSLDNAIKCFHLCVPFLQDRNILHFLILFFYKFSRQISFYLSSTRVANGKYNKEIMYGVWFKFLAKYADTITVL